MKIRQGLQSGVFAVWTLTVVLTLLALLDGRVTLTHAATSGRNFQVTGQTLPPTLTSPSKVQGGTTNTDTDVTYLIIANTGSSDRTVTVADCSVSAFYLFNAYTIPAKAMWGLPLANTRFKGCLKWSASSTEVMGTIVGTY